MTDWLKQFLYYYDCPQLKIEFNLSPSKYIMTPLRLFTHMDPQLMIFLFTPSIEIPSKTPLRGRALECAKKALSWSATLEDGSSLLTLDNLIKCDFKPGGGIHALVSSILLAVVNNLFISYFVNPDAYHFSLFTRITCHHHLFCSLNASYLFILFNPLQVWPPEFPLSFRNPLIT